MITNTGSYYKEINNIPTLYPLTLSILTCSSILFLCKLTEPGSSNVYTYILCSFTLFTLSLTLSAIIICAITFINMKIMSYISIGGIKYTLRKCIPIISFVLVLLALFTLFKEFRASSNAARNHGNVELTRTINEFIGPTEQFHNLEFPGAVLWPYAYIVSPIHNFSAAILYYKHNQCELNGIRKSFYPQSLQNYTKLPNSDESLVHLPNPLFNVSTAFFVPYVYCGWFGVFFYTLIQAVIFFTAVVVSQHTTFARPVVGLIGAIVSLQFFDNVFILDIVFIPLVVLTSMALLKRYVDA